MKKTILTFFIFALSFSMFAQNNTAIAFAVDVPTGWANLRAGAGTNHEIIGRVPDKSIVFRDTYRPMRGNWIPITGYRWDWLFYDFRGFSREELTDIGLAYMHESVLMPIQEPYASRLREFRVRERCSDNFYDGKPNRFHRASLMSFHIPNVFLFDDGECNRIVWDFDAEKNIFEMYIMDCYEIMRGDTIRFYRFFHNMIGESRIITPMLAVYRLFRNENGKFDFYTQLLPQPRTIPIEEAQQIVTTIRQAIVRDLDGNAEMLYLHDNFFPQFWQQLFLAYVSGVKEARDIINASGCDASICLDLTWIRSMFDAYRRSKLNPR